MSKAHVPMNPCPLVFVLLRDLQWLVLRSTNASHRIDQQLFLVDDSESLSVESLSQRISELLILRVPENVAL